MLRLQFRNNADTVLPFKKVRKVLFLDHNKKGAEISI